MKIKCKVCNQEFETEPVSQTTCGEPVASDETYMTSIVKTVCPECESKESSN